MYSYHLDYVVFEMVLKGSFCGRKKSCRFMKSNSQDLHTFRKFFVGDGIEKMKYCGMFINGFISLKYAILLFNHIIEIKTDRHEKLCSFVNGKHNLALHPAVHRDWWSLFPVQASLTRVFGSHSCIL